MSNTSKYKQAKPVQHFFKEPFKKGLQTNVKLKNAEKKAEDELQEPTISQILNQDNSMLFDFDIEMLNKVDGKDCLI